MKGTSESRSIVVYSCDCPDFVILNFGIKVCFSGSVIKQIATADWDKLITETLIVFSELVIAGNYVIFISVKVHVKDLNCRKAIWAEKLNNLIAEII